MRSEQLSLTSSVPLSSIQEPARASNESQRMHRFTVRETERLAEATRTGPPPADMARTSVPVSTATVVATTRVTTHVTSHAEWYAIARCESGQRWSLNSGNGYWGGLQFSPGTWFSYGGGPFDGAGPFPYSAAQQIAVAERVLAAQGPGAWPACFQYG